MRAKGKANYGRSTGDPYLDLWAAIIRRAILDAKKGNRKAAVWLWCYEPTIAELAADRMLAQPDKSPFSDCATAVEVLTKCQAT